jgi:beta-catenin-like protein 1
MERTACSASHFFWSAHRFIDSEADLDSAIKALLPLAQAPVLAYPELVRSGTVALLIGLLSHENADIVIDVVEVIHELTDEDVGNEAEEEEEERTAEEALKILIEGLVRAFHLPASGPLTLLI